MSCSCGASTHNEGEHVRAEKVRALWPSGNPYERFAGSLENVTVHQHRWEDPCTQACLGYTKEPGPEPLELSDPDPG